MRRPLVLAALACGVAIVAGLLIFMPWLYYDLMVKPFASPLPEEAERFVLEHGRIYCSIGRDSDCGGYRIVNARQLPIQNEPQLQNITSAWCVHYVVRRQNTGRVTAWLSYWTNIHQTMIVTRANDGRYEAFEVEGCTMPNS